MSRAGEDLFRLFMDDDDDAFLELLELDRSRYYDYVFRMTGNEFAARETLAALTSFGLDKGRRYATLDGLRAALFNEARAVNRDKWNAPTHGSPEMPEEVTFELKSLGLDDLDRAFRSLPGPEREVLILLAQNGFSPASVATIIGVSEDKVEEWRTRGENMLALVVGRDSDFVSGLQRLPFNVGELSSEHATVALSQVINAVRKVKPGLRAHFPWARLLFFFILMALIGGGIFVLLK